MDGARASLQAERQPFAVLDPDTTDYYDATGLPPPHRLSNIHSPSPYSPAHSPRGSFDYSSNNGSRGATGYNYVTPPFELDRPRASLSATDPFASARDGFPTAATSSSMAAASSPFHNGAAVADRSYYPPAPLTMPSYEGGGGASNRHADYDERDAWNVNSGADEGWGASSHSLSPAVAARERYMARKEADLAAGEKGGAYGMGAAAAAKASKRRKWLIVGGIVAILVIIAAVVGGVVASKNRSGGSSSNGVAGVVSSDPNDPSIFTKDPALKKSFYGMAYSPLNAQYPACGDTLAEVIEDIQLLSQLTKRIRVYGSDCNVASYVLEAIQRTKVDMTVYLATWLPQQADDPDGSTYARQVQAVVDAITKFGIDHVGGISVGNEFLLNGGSTSYLVQKMADMRTTLAGLNLPKTIPVGTADAGSMITTALGNGADYIMANNHAWFGGVPVDQAAGWTWNYQSKQEPSSVLLSTPKVPQLFIAETGWPSDANTTEFLRYEASVAGIPQVQTFLDTYVCQANTNITNSDPYSPYFYFEFLDEPWKRIYGGVEPYWGLFSADKKLKAGLTIPDCLAP